MLWDRHPAQFGAPEVGGARYGDPDDGRSFSAYHHCRTNVLVCCQKGMICSNYREKRCATPANNAVPESVDNACYKWQKGSAKPLLTGLLTFP